MFLHSNIHLTFLCTHGRIWPLSYSLRYVPRLLSITAFVLALRRHAHYPVFSTSPRFSFVSSAGPCPWPLESSSIHITRSAVNCSDFLSNFIQRKPKANVKFRVRLLEYLSGQCLHRTTAVRPRFVAEVIISRLNKIQSTKIDSK